MDWVDASNEELKELSKKAIRIMRLAEMMDWVFGSANEKDHLRIAIMAGLKDEQDEQDVSKMSGEQG